MKASCPLFVLVVAAALLGAAVEPTFAQTAPVIRGDAAATIGWLSVRTPASEFYDDGSRENSLFGSAAVGWHWTDHLKTEVDFGGSTTMHTFRTEPVVIAGRPTYRTTRTAFSRRTLAIGQQYQFFHNAWFHPHVAAGAAITWESRRAQGLPVFAYDAGGLPVAAPETADARRTTAAIRPFVGTGFKAYITERSFFRSDARVAFRGGADEVVLRIGFGIDF